MKDIILIINKFLTSGECKKLIKIYQDNEHVARRWPREAEKPCGHAIGPKDISSPLLNKVLKKMEKIVQKYFGSRITLDWGELKKHDKGASHNFHYDTSSNRTVLSSITYLNDLSDGHTIFKDRTQICPKAGRIIMFDGRKYLHGCRPTTEDRYTIPIWYK